MKFADVDIMELADVDIMELADVGIHGVGRRRHHGVGRRRPDQEGRLPRTLRTALFAWGTVWYSPRLWLWLGAGRAAGRQVLSKAHFPWVQS
jgi:hypothetical protein